MKSIARLSLLALAILSCTASAREIVVPDDASTIRVALNQARLGDVVRLRPGTYTESSLNLVAGVTIHGDVNAPGRHVIDAGRAGRVVRAEGVADCRLEGLTIVGGHANGPSSYSGSGGGLFISRSSAVLQRVRFVDNTADASGGGLRVAYGDVELVDCEFVDCTATKGGGAVDLSYESTVNITGTRFLGNGAAWGGAISVRSSSSCFVENSVFRQNSTAPPQELGGAFFADHAARVTFTHCVLTDNSARQGGAARLADAVSGFSNCTIDGNQARDGGAGLMVRGGTLVLDHSIVSFNQGDAVTVQDGEVFIMATDVYGNSLGDWRGDIAHLRDVNDNLSLDPEYCDEGVYELAASSPCAEENSPVGRIGALGVGCENVGITVNEFGVDPSGRGLVLNWALFDHGGWQFRLVGRSLADTSVPEWVVPHLSRGHDCRFEARDDPAPELFPVEYTLAVRQGRGDWQTVAVRRVDAPPAPEHEFAIEAAYPNPFNPNVTIAFGLDRSGLVRATIYDLQGRRVRTLVQGELAAGRHTIGWNSLDDAGRPQPTGTYVLRIEAGGKLRSQKLLLVK